MPDYEPLRNNSLSLLDDKPLGKHLKPLKVGERNTPLELSLEEFSINSDYQLNGRLMNGSITSGQKYLEFRSGEYEGAGTLATGGKFVFTDTATEYWVSQGYADRPFEMFLVQGSPYLRSGSDVMVVGAESFSLTDKDVGITGKTHRFKTNEYYQYSANNNANDYFKIATASDGATTLSTVDSDGTAGNFTIDADGDIFLDSAGADIQFQVGGTSYLEWNATGTLTMKSVIDTGDVATISCGTHGTMTLATTDDDATAGHISLDADGDIVLDSHSGNFIAKKGATEFSSANSAYAGMILGYTCINVYAVHYLETSFTVEDAGHKVTFVVPPSGNVEIEFTGFFDRTSTSDVTVYAGLSDNSTYNSVGNTHEYDYNGVKSDDEIDDELITFKWCVTGLTAGASTTYYLGLKSSDASAVFVKYGYRSANGLAYHPFIFKATALPATIYDGT